MLTERDTRLGRDKGLKHTVLFIRVSIQQEEQGHDNRRRFKLELSKAIRQIEQQQALLRDIQPATVDRHSGLLTRRQDVRDKWGGWFGEGV